MILNFAHRGSLTEAPENTLPAIQKALDHGAKAIEIDVQLTKDHQLIVIHDQSLERFNSVLGLVKDYTLEELKKIDIGSTFSKDFAGVTLATLDEIMQIVPSNILINIEIKNMPIIYDNIEQLILECLKRYDRLDTVIISSFDHKVLERFQKLAPDCLIGLLFYYRMLKPWNYAKNCGLNVYSIHPNVAHTDEELIKECQNVGYKVYPYTVNMVEKYEELVDWGVDGVFSNNPQIFKL